MRSGGCPAGSGRALRLDPFALPVRFAASDAAADERVRHVELHRERVVVRRSLARHAHGAQHAGLGLCRRFAALTRGEGEAGRVAVMLAHKDPALALPLFSLRRSRRRHGRMAHLGARARPAAAGRRRRLCASRSRAWAALRVDAPRPRRRRRSASEAAAVDARCGATVRRLTGATPVHRGEREIIARN